MFCVLHKISVSCGLILGIWLSLHPSRQAGDCQGLQKTVHLTLPPSSTDRVSQSKLGGGGAGVQTLWVSGSPNWPLAHKLSFGIHCILYGKLNSTWWVRKLGQIAALVGLGSIHLPLGLQTFVCNPNQIKAH